MFDASPEDIAAAERLTRVLASFSDEEVDGALPVLFLGAVRGLPNLELPRAAEERIGRFVVDIGVNASSSPEQMLEALERYMQEARSPLLQALAQFFREENARGAGGGAGRAFATFVGAATKGVLDSGARPTGTVPAGPMARFLVGDGGKKK